MTETITEAIYDQINALRQNAYRKHFAELTAAGEWSDDYSIPHLSWLGETDWTADEVYGQNLGDPEADWCVSIQGDDTVSVFAAGDIVASEIIPGAGALGPVDSGEDE